MRIALVSPYALDVAGGVQVHVRALATALRAAGDDVLVVGPGGPAPASGGADGVRVHTLGRTWSVPANGSRAPIALGAGAARRVRALLRRAAADVVHVHEPLVPVVGPAAVLAGDGAARVLTFHANAEGGALPALYRAVGPLARAVVARAQARTAVSEVAAAFHARMLGVDADSFTIVPNGVDVARFAAARMDRARPAVRRVVFLGRLEHRKGADTALDAFLALAERNPNLHLRIVGDGPLADALAHRRDAAAASVGSRVELAGRAASSALPALLADADVAVLPARGGESFGIVLLEAMAAGVPIVATDIPGYRAVARHDREALLVPPDDPAALAGALARLLDDAALAERLRAAGRARAEEHAWAHVARRMREVYADAAR